MKVELPVEIAWSHTSYLPCTVMAVWDILSPMAQNICKMLTRQGLFALEIKQLPGFMEIACADCLYDTNMQTRRCGQFHSLGKK